MYVRLLDVQSELVGSWAQSGEVSGHFGSLIFGSACCKGFSFCKLPFF
jgi:hypothetical protein